ncbi:hypothetical protein IE53DRAFT_380889 [Violaceomyces palustris]|uniref:Uncharacterized protein n=1 Tax=Violaceomyces palustris TaxID=1673888 RepID=A0ACD0NT60_9BASI|nr:hypothetical protein IE53DRAFT_380889 [Violaceomyces palustris]
MIKATRSDRQLWERILRYEPIPFDEFFSLAEREKVFVTADPKPPKCDHHLGAGKGREKRSQVNGYERIEGEKGGVQPSQARKREILRSFLDDQCICHYTSELGDGERPRR